MDLDSKNTWATLLESDWPYDILELDLESTQTTLLDLDWYYALNLDLKNTSTNLLDSDWLCYNQTGMLLEKYEDLLEFICWAISNTVKFDFPGSDYVWCGQNQVLMLFVAKLGIFISNKIYPGSVLIQFRNYKVVSSSNKSRLLSKRVVQIISCKLPKKFV